MTHEDEGWPFEVARFRAVADETGVPADLAALTWQMSRRALRLTPSDSADGLVRVGGSAGSLGGCDWPVRTTGDDPERFGRRFKFVAEIGVEALADAGVGPWRDGVVKLFADADDRYGGASDAPGSGRLIHVASPLRRSSSPAAVDREVLEDSMLAHARLYALRSALSLPFPENLRRAWDGRIGRELEEALGRFEREVERVQGYVDLTGFCAYHHGEQHAKRHQLLGNWLPVSDDIEDEMRYFFGEPARPLLQLVADPSLEGWFPIGTILTFAVAERHSDNPHPRVEAMTQEAYGYA